MDDNVESWLADHILMSCVIYQVSAIAWRSLTDAEMEQQIKQFRETACKELLKGLEKRGLTIIPKEPIPDVFNY